MAKNNYPQGQLDDMQAEKVQELVTSLKQLHDRGKPETDEEIKQRIDEYFSFCERSSIRPGIESLCLSLHISRTTLFNWNRQIGCSEKCQEYIQSAKAFIAAFIEQALLSGKISPPSGIFLAKNWLGYKDTVSIEESTRNTEQELITTRTPEDIAKEYGIAYTDGEMPKLPEMPELPED